MRVTCGTHTSKTYKQDTDNKGIATFAEIAIEDSWQGQCEVKAEATVEGENIFRTAKFTITAASDGSGKGDDNGDDNGDTLQILQWKIGKGYPLASLADGKLTMHNCDKGRLYQMLGDEPPQLKEEIEVSKDTSHIFVVNAPDSGCELQLDGKTYIQLSKDENHPLKDIWRGFGSQMKGRPFIVKLNNKPDDTSSAQLYRGSQLAKFDGNISWGGDTNLGGLDAKTSINNQVMLKVVVNNDIWHAWNRMHPHIAGSVAIGKLGYLNGLGASPIDITLVKDCGMQIIHIESHGTPNTEIKNGFALNHKLTLTPDNSGMIAFVLLGTKNAGCQITFKIADLAEAITYATDWDIPTMPSGSTLTESGGKAMLTLPATVPNRYRSGEQGKIYASNDGGKTWTKASSTVTWGTQGSLSDLLSWNSNASMNAVVIYTDRSVGKHFLYLRGS